MGQEVADVSVQQVRREAGKVPESALFPEGLGDELLPKATFFLTSGPFSCYLLKRKWDGLAV